MVVLLCQCLVVAHRAMVAELLNDNVGDAQKEIRDMFRKVTDALAFSDLSENEINSLLH